MITVLHITPHLGGGVGKALSSLVEQTRLSGAPVQHIIACLEVPEKSQFIDLIRSSGSEVIVAPDRSLLDDLVSNAEIVQLEWWNHPATIECLCRLTPQPIRLLTWCHVSGLHNPILPPKLIEASHRFIFTSPCSYEAKEVAERADRLGNRLAVVSSGGGFSGLPEPKDDETKSISVGYLGSLNFAKLHPEYVKFLSVVSLPNFQVHLIGDFLNKEVLEQQCNDADRTGMLDFRGYTHDVAAELASINVLAYLLNPNHYGTAENALLEAMAMGIVPVVLDNPAERHIIDHLLTGIVVRSPQEFSEAITWLAAYPVERSRIGRRAASHVRQKYSLESMEVQFRSHYESVSILGKAIVDFQSIFGTSPEQWFLACQAYDHPFKPDGRIHLSDTKRLGYEYFESNKGSVFHFLTHFPESKKLQSWANNLQESK